MVTKRAELKAKKIFRSHGGILSTSETIRSGVHPVTLYGMLKNDSLEQISRGRYRLADMLAFCEPDIVTIALRSRQGVICLVSALSFHELTLQIPRQIYMAIPAGRKPPILTHPPIRVFYYSRQTFGGGVETHEMNGVKVRIYSPERTLADCFKFRNKIGTDVAIEALKMYFRRRKSDVNLVMRFARMCRVEKVMAPYLETVLG